MLSGLFKTVTKTYEPIDCNALKTSNYYFLNANYYFLNEISRSNYYFLNELYY